MKNTSFTLLALGGLSTALFAFTTPRAASRISPTGKDSTATMDSVAMDSTAFSVDSAARYDSAAKYDSAAFRTDSAARYDSASFRTDSAAKYDSASTKADFATRLDSAVKMDSTMRTDSAAGARFDSAAVFAGTQIKGHIDPAGAAVAVVAFSSNDSTKVTVTDGSFILNEKPGTYKIVVEANPPYKNAVKDDVQVVDGNVTDLGTIKLQQ